MVCARRKILHAADDMDPLANGPASALDCALAKRLDVLLG